MLNKVDLFGSGDTSLLDMHNLVDGLEGSALALVMKAVPGMTRYEHGFFTFYVKDRRGNVIPARLFNVKDFSESGLVAKAYEGKPVQIKFTSQIFNGSWSLLVKEIELFNGKFDYDIFVGKVDFDEAMVRELFASRKLVLNPDLLVYALPQICNGKVGGFGKLIEAAYKTLMGYASMVTDFDVLLDVFVRSICGYFAKCKQEALHPVPNQVALLNAIITGVQNAPNKNILTDSLQAIMGFGKPTFMESHLVYNAIVAAKNNLTIIEINNSAVKGAFVEVPGGRMTRI